MTWVVQLTQTKQKVCQSDKTKFAEINKTSTNVYVIAGICLIVLNVRISGLTLKNITYL